MATKMLIVDDEPVMCQGLASTIPWEDLGIEVAGCAYNGEQAMKIMATDKVDIVLTDVSMPKMDGLSLSKKIAEDHPDTRVIMISGYEEFDYARQAIRLGVEDYLLKPVDIDELMELVQKIQRKISEQKEKDTHNQQELISQKILHYLFNVPLSAQAKEHNVPVFCYRLLLCEIARYHQLIASHPENKMRQLKETWKQIIHDVFKESGIKDVSVYNHENQLVTICYSEDSSKLADDHVENICQEIQERWVHELLFIVSSRHQQLSKLTTIHKDMETRLGKMRGKQAFLVFADAKKPKNGSINYPKQEEASLHEAILKQDKIEVRQILKKVFENFQKQNGTLEQTLEISRVLETVLKSRLQEVNPSERLSEISFHLHQNVDLKIYNSFDAITELLEQDISHLIDSLGEKDKEHWIIDNVKQYMEKNFQKDLKANEVAKQHFITPNYFSMLFKQETGYNYSEYLNKLRINRARELLLTTSNRVFEIAEYVGYKEYKYFVQVFKKYVGVTPTQYRKINTSANKVDNKI